MKRVRGLVFSLGVALLAGGCTAGAAAGGAAAGPVTSPTGKEYAPGTPPRQTEFSKQAQINLVKAQAAPEAQAEPLYREALQRAEAGIAADSANPIHYFLAGSAYAGLGEYTEADRAFDRAEEIYPAYEMEIEPVRLEAWGRTFNEGVTRYNEDATEEAVRLWTEANVIYDKRPEAYLNLAAVNTQAANYDAAVEMYRGALAALDREPAITLTPEEVAERANTRTEILTNLGQLLLFTERYADAEQVFRQHLEAKPGDVTAQSNLAVVQARLGKREEAMATYERLLSATDLPATDVFDVGVGLFQIEEYDRAAQAFKRVTEVLPQSRDAWYNYLNALYAQKEYEELIPVAERVIALDPLNADTYLILAASHREAKKNQKALEALQAKAALPVTVSGMQVRARDDRSTLQGTVTGGAARAGTPIQMEFSFFGATGETLGTKTVTVAAPREGETASFEVDLESATPVVAYSYTVVR